MAAGLEEAWKRLSLTPEEEVVVECDDDAPNDRNEQVALCKLHTNNYFNASALKSVLKNVWKPSKGVIIRELDKNLFVFQFFSAADKAYVLNKGPWAFDGNILLLRELTRLEQPSEVEFTKARFWVTALAVPQLKQTSSFAKILGDHPGTFIKCDDSNLYCAADKSVNSLVDVDVTKPLLRGIRVMVQGRSCVKLSEFCYGCDKLGHTLKDCDSVDPSVDEELLQYGDWLRGSLIKSLRRNAELERSEEKGLFTAYRNSKSTLKGCTKLRFSNDSSPPDITLRTSLSSPPVISDNMLLDETSTITPGTEVFKRKMQDKGRSGDLALLGRKGLDVKLLSMSLHHIEVAIKGLGVSNEWRFTGIYGWPENQFQTLTGELIYDLSNRSNLPWLVGGDLNEI
ncbi:LOW QUALITY PROTEIN: hypothetical protein Cgig2_008099 [Carnegiea gigantea]|uniref:CCHC-type domain-containing protein n=1 Tax=Carnegiea gigantea TaxID=171969 RepID=A0A9Q1L072_9CARY|nr:LOW QUALITY PROTEIN: hypothetical protein Cgig2_008099 [Carnegiea gigantea]